MNEVTIKTRSFPSIEQPDDSECSICLETFDGSKRSVTTTECHHTFDSECLAKWLTHKPCCPLCYKMLSDRSACGVSQEVVPEEPICPICRDCLERPEEPVSITPCLHRFHSGCLSRWSDGKPAPFCPMCRTLVPKSRAPESRLLSLPPTDFSQTEMACPICMDYLSSSRVILTPCGHYFHSICLNHWSANRRGSSCPACRALLPHPDAIERTTLRESSSNVGALGLLVTSLIGGSGALRNTHCPICRYSFDDDERILRTACDHDFHMHCLQQLFLHPPFQRLCPYCQAPLEVSTLSPVARDSGYDSQSIPDRALPDSANPPAGENTNTAGRSYVVIDIPESNDNEVDSYDGLPTRFIRRRGGRAESCCQIL